MTKELSSIWFTFLASVTMCDCLMNCSFSSKASDDSGCVLPLDDTICQGGNCNATGQMMSWFSPTNEILPEIVSRLKWKSVVIIFDAEHESVVLPLTSTLSSHGLSFILYQHDVFLGNNGLDRLAHTGNDAWLQRLNFLLLCSKKQCDDILQHADRFQSAQGAESALSVTSEWLILQDPSASPPLDLTKFSMMHAAVLYCRAHNTCCPDITSPEQDQWSAESQCGAIVTLMWRADQRWTLCAGNVRDVISGKTDVFPGRHWGFNQRQFVVGTLPWTGFMETAPSSNGSIWYSGLCMDLLHILASELNFTYQIVQPQDGIWGLQYDNGTWAGLVGQLANHRVDMVVAPLTVTKQREEVMDFTYPFFNDADTFIYRRPDPSRDKWKTYLRPLSWQVLVCIVISLIVMVFILGFVESWTPLYPSNRLAQGRGRHSCYSRSFRLLYGALFAHADVYLPKSCSSRLLVSAWWLFCIVVAATYSGNLVAFLTVDRSSPLFLTLQDLLAQNTYRWGFMGGSAIHQTVKGSKLTTFQTMWAGIQEWEAEDPNYLIPDPAVHYNRVLAGQYAFVSDRATFERWAAAHCDLDLARETFLPTDYGVGLPNNSAFNRLFSEEILRMHESGLLSHWRDKWWTVTTDQPCQTSTVTAAATKATLMDMQSAFYILAIGCTLGILSLSLECVWKCTVCRRVRDKFIHGKETT